MKEARGRERERENGSSLPKFLVLMEQVRFSYQFIVSRVS